MFFGMLGIVVRAVVLLFAASTLLAAFGACPVLAAEAAFSVSPPPSHHGDAESGNLPEHDQPASHCAKALSLAAAAVFHGTPPLSFKKSLPAPFAIAAAHAAYLPADSLSGSGLPPVPRGSPFRAFFAQTHRMLI